jgi:hypothetical protein
MENRIKEQFTLFADRVSAESIRANQMRLYLSAMAYLLVSGLRRLGLKATELATAQAATIRLRLFKIGALCESPFAECGSHYRAAILGRSCSLGCTKP